MASSTPTAASAQASTTRKQSRVTKFLYPPGLFAEHAILVTDEEHYAIKAVAAGTAIAGQQKLALKTIVEKFCGYYELSIRGGPEGRRETDMNEGRRFVGAHIVHECNTARPNKTPAAKPPAPKRPQPPRSPKPATR
jgi:hypothetical protein